MIRTALVLALVPALTGCTTAQAGPIPRVIDVTNSHQAALD